LLTFNGIDSAMNGLIQYMAEWHAHRERIIVGMQEKVRVCCSYLNYDQAHVGFGAFDGVAQQTESRL
jgi:hypothetical protein